MTTPSTTLSSASPYSCVDSGNTSPPNDKRPGTPCPAWLLGRYRQRNAQSSLRCSIYYREWPNSLLLNRNRSRLWDRRKGPLSLLPSQGSLINTLDLTNMTNWLCLKSLLNICQAGNQSRKHRWGPSSKDYSFMKYTNISKPWRREYYFTRISRCLLSDLWKVGRNT